MDCNQRSKNFTISADGKKLVKFDFCNSIAIVPNGIEIVGKYAFYAANINYSWLLQKVVLPETTKVIEEKAFLDNKNLEEINIPDSVVEIQNDAFQECHKLKSIQLPDGLTSIEHGILAGCKSIQAINLPSGLVIIKEHGLFGLDKIIDLYVPEGVKEIGDCAFALNTLMESIYLPSTLTKIGTDIFDRCTSLKKIYIHPNCIEYHIYNDIMLNRNGTEIICAIKNFSNRNITIPNGVKSINERAFAHSNIQTINIVHTVNSIWQCAFEACKHLKFIYIPDGVAFYGWGHFQYTGIEEIRLPNDMEDIPPSFLAYAKLKSINLPTKIKNIKERAFAGTQIEQISLPTNTMILGKDAFTRCKQLVDVNINCGLTIISDGCFSECTALESITIPESVEELGDNCFSLCYNLKEIHFMTENPTKKLVANLDLLKIYGICPRIYVPIGCSSKFLESGLPQHLKIIEE